MSVKHKITVGLLVTAIICGALIAVDANTESVETVPYVYYSLDKTKPWNDLARNLDPRISDGEYDAMRSKYFSEVVLPHLSNNITDQESIRREFMERTNRPWRWDRRPSKGEPSPLTLILFFVSWIWLLVITAKWAWKRVLVPAAGIVRDQGVVGLARVVLHGKSRIARP